MKKIFAALALTFLSSSAFADRGYEVEFCNYEWGSYFSSKKLTIYTNEWTVNLCFLERDNQDGRRQYKCQGVAYAASNPGVIESFYDRNSKGVYIILRDKQVLECPRKD